MSKIKKLNKAETAYREAKIQRSLAQIKFGRDSEQFKAADLACKTSYAKYAEVCRVCGYSVNN